MTKKPASLPLVGMICMILLGCDRCSGSKETAAVAPATTPGAVTEPAASTPPPAPAETPAGDLQIVDIKEGEGDEVKEGKKISVQYKGTLVDGTVFDDTHGRAAPVTFVVGSGMVISGMDQGVKGMKVGGERKLIVPPNLAYGNRSVGGSIAPNSTLIFDIELVKIE